MKNYITITLLILLSYGNMSKVLSQCTPEVKVITTDPRNNFDNSINLELPSKENNAYDWTSVEYNVNSSNLPYATTIRAPFAQVTNGPLGAFLENPDVQPQDGWELIAYELGFDENNVAVTYSVGHVYFVLYNKHTGIMRVFVAGNQQTPYQGARISISMNGSLSEIYSSVLSNASDLFALDKFEPEPKQNAVIPYRNDPELWYFADFQMSYDPCTCLYESGILIYL